MMMMMMLESLKLPFQISTFPRREIPMTRTLFWKDLVVAVKTLQSQFQILQAEKRQARHGDLRISGFMVRLGVEIDSNLKTLGDYKNINVDLQL